MSQPPRSRLHASACLPHVARYDHIFHLGGGEVVERLSFLLVDPDAAETRELEKVDPHVVEVRESE